MRENKLIVVTKGRYSSNYLEILDQIKELVSDDVNSEVK
jgi:hypothetical protein